MVRSFLTGLALVAAGSSVASAAFVSPAWSRGTANSRYAEWDVFSSTTGPNNPPDVGVFPSPAPLGLSISDSSGGSFIPGSGNLYSPTAVLDIDLNVPQPALAGGFTQVLLQVKTQGTEIAPASMRIGGVTPYNVQEISRVSINSPGGATFIVETAFRWNLPGNAASYLIEFNAAGTSMSLDRVAVDTLTSVPEPTSLALLGVASLLLVRRRTGA